MVHTPLQTYLEAVRARSARSTQCHSVTKQGLATALKDKPLGEMTLEELKQVDHYWRLRSSLVKDDLYLATNESVTEKLRSHGLACYLLEEAIRLKGCSPQMIRAIHVVKKTFPGNTMLDDSFGPNATQDPAVKTRLIKELQETHNVVVSRRKQQSQSRELLNQWDAIVNGLRTLGCKMTKDEILHGFCTGNVERHEPSPTQTGMTALPGRQAGSG